MRILIYEPWLQAAGTTTWARYLKVGFERNGHEVEIWSSPSGPDQQLDLADYIFKPDYKKGRFEDLLAELKRFKPDFAVVSNGQHVSDKYFDIPVWLDAFEQTDTPFIPMFHNNYKQMERMQPHMSRIMDSDHLKAIWTYSQEQCDYWKQRSMNLVPVTWHLLPYEGPQRIKVTDRPRVAIYTSRMLKGKGADMAMLMAKEYQLPIEMYGWFPQHRGGTTEDELKATPWWVDGIHKSVHVNGAIVHPLLGEVDSVYERGRVHLNLNRWPDGRGQFEYVSLEAMGFGCIPVAREEHFHHFKVLDQTSSVLGLMIPNIRKMTGKPEMWKETADRIQTILAWDDDVWAGAREENWAYLEQNHLPEIVAENILAKQDSSRDSTVAAGVVAGGT